MAWIKSHQELRNHPKTSRLSRFCGISFAQAIGHLHILWWSALDYADDGDLSTLDNEEIAALAGWDGNAAAFVEALYRAGFVDEANRGYVIHDWGEYAGKLVDDREKKREQDRERAKTYRERMKDRHATVTHDNVTHNAIVAPVDKTRKDKTIEEQSRDTPLIPASGEDAPQVRDVSTIEQRFNEFWEAYPKKAAKQTAFKAWKKVNPTAELHARILTAIEAAKRSDKWCKDNGQFIPNPATWINGGCWDDEIPIGGSANYGDIEHRTETNPKSVTQADLPGFHNALDRYKDIE